MILMKKSAAFIAFFCLAQLVFCRPAVKELSSFTLMGEVELYENPGFSSPSSFKTLNHENGLKCVVMSSGKRENGGQWLYVLLRNGLWEENGDWLSAYSKFWIFLSDDTEIFDFEG